MYAWKHGVCLHDVCIHSKHHESNYQLLQKDKIAPLPFNRFELIAKTTSQNIVEQMKIPQITATAEKFSSELSSKLSHTF